MTERTLGSEFFIFEVPLTASGTRSTVVFTPQESVDEGRLVQAFRHHAERALPPDEILLIAPAAAETDLVSLSRSEGLIPFTRHVDPPPIVPLTFDAFGGLSDQQESRPEEFRQKLVRVGLLHMFKERRGFLAAGPSFHYVNPSGRHTNKFIRAADLLLHSAEIGFIAFGLLPWTPGEIKHLYTDTASINAVAYALVDLRCLFDPTFTRPTIDSFGSYHGLARLKDVDERARSLCLVSASTSGALVRRIEETGFETNRILTLLYCGKAAPTTRVLCDVTQRQPADEGEEAPEGYDPPEESCAFCDGGSAVVQISGDQFLPASPIITDVTLRADMAPPWFRRVLPLLIGRSIIRAHYGRSEEVRQTRQIYLDLDDDARDGASPFGERVRRVLATYVPADLRWIVHPPDRSSAQLAEVVREFHSRSAREQLDASHLISSDELTRQPGLRLGGGAALVVASSTATGRDLLAISLALRNAHRNDAESAPVAYLIGALRLPRARARDHIISNLGFGEMPNDHPVRAILTLELPDDTNPGGSPWTAEKELLSALLSPDESSAAVMRQLTDERRQAAIHDLEARRDTIDQAESDQTRGLVNNLYLPKIMDGELRLDDASAQLSIRPGFAFWTDFPTEGLSPTQADVFFTVTAVLHALRELRSGEDALFQYEHNQRVLSPTNFSRFNDGAIQASFLRASLPGELDFCYDDRVSLQMRDFLSVAIRSAEQLQGEALPEFVLALALGRLHLAPRDMGHIFEELLADPTRLPPLVEALARYAKTRPDRVTHK